MKNSIKLILISCITLGALAAFDATAKVPADKLEIVEKLKKKRGGKVLGTRIGKKVAEAFDLYSKDDSEGALAILLELEPRGAFDKAYVDRYIGSLYAGVEGKTKTALEYLKNAKNADVLPFDDHASVIRLIADLSMQEQDYEFAIKTYHEYTEFSYNLDATVFLRIGSAHYELKQYDKIIEPAKRAIELFDKPNQNPYVLIMASYYERKMYPETIKATETLLKVFPEDPKWWRQLGMFYMLVEDYEKGLSTMEVAYKQGFLETESQVKTLAQLYATNGIPYKSALIQEKFIDDGIIEKTELALSNMAATFRNAKEYEKAAKYYGIAASMDKDADLYRKQAEAFMAIERFSDAVVAYNKAIDAGVKRKGIVYMGIAEANFYQEKWKEAHAAILEAKKDRNTERSAKAWEGHIKDTAQRKGVTL